MHVPKTGQPSYLHFYAARTENKAHKNGFNELLKYATIFKSTLNKNILQNLHINQVKMQNKNIFIFLIFTIKN